MLSRSAVNVDEASRRKHKSNAVCAWWVAKKSLLKSSAETIRVPADLDVDFKRCCMLSGEFDGSDRNYYCR